MMSKWNRALSQTGRAIAWNAVQRIGARGLSLVRFLILARLLAPEDFGLLAIAAVVVDAAVAFTESGMAQAIVQRRDVEEEHLDTAWTYDLIRGVTIGALLWWAAPTIADIFGEPAAVNMVRVLGLRPLVSSLASPMLPVLTRRLDFRSLAKMRLAEATVDLTVAVGVAVAILEFVDIEDVAGAPAGAWALVAGTLAGALASTVLSYLVAPRRPRFVIHLVEGWQLYRFGRWVVLSGAIAMVVSFVLRWVLARQLGATELGIFYLAIRVATLPNDAVTTLLSNVAFPLVSRVGDDPDRARWAFQRVLTAMLVPLVPVYALVAVLAGSGVEAALGARWLAVVPVLRILAFDGIVDTLPDALRPVLKGLGRPELHVQVKVVRAVVVLALAWSVVGWLGVAGAAWTWLLAESMAAAASWRVAARAIPRPFSGYARVAAAIALAGAASGVAAWAIDRSLPLWPGLVVGGMVGLLSAAFVLATLDSRWDLGLRADVRRLFPAEAR